jgi:hypothetical protein
MYSNTQKITTMEKIKTSHMHDFQAMGKSELMQINGGSSWVDLIWMCAEDMIRGYIGICRRIWNYHVENGGKDARIAIRLTH